MKQILGFLSKSLPARASPVIVSSVITGVKMTPKTM